MNTSPAAGDLVVLVADKNMEAFVKGLLGRPKSLAIRPVRSRVYVHFEKDPGVYLRAHDFLRRYVPQYARALAIFDREGCGNDGLARKELEKEVEERLALNGWADRSKAVVIDPELESWVWSDSPQVAQQLGWGTCDTELRSWVTEQGFSWNDNGKPNRPKEAVEAALRRVRKPRSSGVYGELAQRVSLRRCQDPAFLKFKETLQQWFPET